jgi:hypothetical protein
VLSIRTLIIWPPVAILADSRAHWATVQDDVHSVSRANDLISAALIGKKQAARWSRQLRSPKKHAQVRKPHHPETEQT